MKIFAEIENGVVINTSVADDDWTPPEGYVEVEPHVCRGWLYEGGKFSAPVPVLPKPPEEISDRQFFHALALTGQITKQEALEAVKIGTLPAALEAFIGAMPEEEQFNARMLLEGATKFERSHPLTLAFAQKTGMKDEDVDALWRLAASL